MQFINKKVTYRQSGTVQTKKALYLVYQQQQQRVVAFVLTLGAFEGPSRGSLNHFNKRRMIESGNNIAKLGAGALWPIL